MALERYMENEDYWGNDFDWGVEHLEMKRKSIITLKQPEHISKANWTLKECENSTILRRMDWTDLNCCHLVAMEMEKEEISKEEWTCSVFETQENYLQRQIERYPVPEIEKLVEVPEKARIGLITKYWASEDKLQSGIVCQIEDPTKKDFGLEWKKSPKGLQMNENMTVSDFVKNCHLRKLNRMTWSVNFLQEGREQVEKMFGNFSPFQDQSWLDVWEAERKKHFGRNYVPTAIYGSECAWSIIHADPRSTYTASFQIEGRRLWIIFLDEPEFILKKLAEFCIKDKLLAQEYKEAIEHGRRQEKQNQKKPGLKEKFPKEQIDYFTACQWLLSKLAVSLTIEVIEELKLRWEPVVTSKGQFLIMKYLRVHQVFHISEDLSFQKEIFSTRLEDYREFKTCNLRDLKKEKNLCLAHCAKENTTILMRPNDNIDWGKDLKRPQEEIGRCLFDEMFKGESVLKRFNSVSDVRKIKKRIKLGVTWHRCNPCGMYVVGRKSHFLNAHNGTIPKPRGQMPKGRRGICGCMNKKKPILTHAVWWRHQKSCKFRDSTIKQRITCK